MKRFFLLLLCLFMLAGCAGQEDVTAGSPMNQAYIDENWDDGVFGQYYTEKTAKKAKFDHLEAYVCYGADMRKMGLTDDEYELICYDSDTRFSKNLPGNFDPEAELEAGKDPGLGIRELHSEGITGKGINIAIIDQPIAPHIEYEGKLKYYLNMQPENTSGSMHGAAHLSIVVGDTCGVAPDASVYYIASPSAGEDVDALRQLLELNRTLPEEDKLDIVSISYGGYNSSVYAEMQEMCAEQDIALITCMQPSPFGPVGRTLSSDPNDLSQMTPCLFYIYGGAAYPGTARHEVCIPIDRRTVAAMSGADKYYHMTFGGASWIPPYVAGVYALAKQADGSLSFAEFEKLAVETAEAVKVYTESGTEYAFNILDPQAIIASLR